MKRKIITDSEKLRIKFHGEMIEVCLGYNASCDSDDAEAFVDEMFEKYSRSETSTDVATWLKEELSNAFRCVEMPPVWVEDEPSWPYYDSRPMVFISQKAIGVESQDLIGWGYVVYLFGAKIVRGKGWDVEFMNVTQQQ